MATEEQLAKEREARITYFRQQEIKWRETALAIVDREGGVEAYADAIEKAEDFGRQAAELEARPPAVEEVRAEPPELGEEIAKELNLRYDGIQEEIGMQFTDIHDTGTTFYAKSLEDARKKLREKRRLFREAGGGKPSRVRFDRADLDSAIAAAKRLQSEKDLYIFATYLGYTIDTRPPPGMQQYVIVHPDSSTETVTLQIGKGGNPMRTEAQRKSFHERIFGKGSTPPLERLGRGQIANDLIPMPPEQGPPLPQRLGIRWPWRKP